MDDVSVIHIILAGDTEKFRILVEQYQQMVFRTCMGFLHNKDDADDLAQEVFIQAYQSLSRFKGESAFSTWLYRIAVNACLNKTRKSSGKVFLQRLDEIMNSASVGIKAIPYAENEDPEKILIRQEHVEWVQKALDSLPENQRTAIILSKYDELSQKEIADILNTTEGAVEALLQRAKKSLREKLSYKNKKNKIRRRKKISFVSNHKIN